MKKSKEAKLVLLNMPGPPKNRVGNENCILQLTYLIITHNNNNTIRQLKKGAGSIHAIGKTIQFLLKEVGLDVKLFYYK